MQNETTDLSQPHNIEAEQGVLGAILLAEEAFEATEQLLIGDEWYVPRHERIFNVMRELHEDGAPIDLITVTSRLQEKKQLDDIGGVLYLSELANNVPTAASIDYYANLVAEKAAQRRSIAMAKELLAEAMKAGNPAELADKMSDSASKLLDRSTRSQDFKKMDEVMRDTFEGIEKRYAHRDEKGVTGIPSGFSDLDRMTGGFQNSDLIIIAARPSVGKTAFALNIAQNVGVRVKKTIAVFSLEMSSTQLGQRSISAEGHVDASRLRSGFLEGDDWEKLTMSLGNLSDSNIYIDDTPAIAVSDIRAKCRRLKKTAGLDMILIDYLQLITVRGNRENRQQEVSLISRTLKQIARELNVPVIALSQLSRGVEQRQDKRPMMSDLRESGSIEQDADIVAFLYRDDYYDKESEKRNIIEIIIAKQRNGPVGTVELAFLKNFNKFLSIDLTHHEPTTKPPAENKNIPDMYRGAS